MIVSKNLLRVVLSVFLFSFCINLTSVYASSNLEDYYFTTEHDLLILSDLSYVDFNARCNLENSNSQKDKCFTIGELLDDEGIQKKIRDRNDVLYKYAQSVRIGKS